MKTVNFQSVSALRSAFRFLNESPKVERKTANQTGKVKEQTVIQPTIPLFNHAAKNNSKKLTDP